MNENRIKLSAENLAVSLMGVATQICMNNKSWQYFEYRSSPQKQRMFDLFMDEFELKKESFLQREIFICVIASALEPLFNFDKISRKTYVAIAHRAVDYMLSISFSASNFGFKNVEESYDYFIEGLNTYLFKDYDKFPVVFSNRVKEHFSIEVEEKNKFLTKWIISATFLFTDSDSDLKHIRNTTKNHHMHDIIDDIESNRVDISVDKFMKGRSINNTLKEKLRSTDLLNLWYVNVFNGFMKQSIGKTTDYGELMNELNRIRESLQEEITVSKKIQPETNEEKNLINKLIEFQMFFIKRIDAFHVLVIRLCDKAEGIGNKYSYFNYKNDLKTLNELEEQSEVIGVKLDYMSTVYLSRTYYQR